ncbi:MAG TPA: electron transfer flavoprotein subunit beta [Nitrososphaeraceae archaeon]|nr:electron transfer flavoprotein subunit beta [Nitrososphaeraceae archaeon]
MLNVSVIIKLEPDFSEGNVSYNSDGTLNRAETKNILGPHSAIACNAAFYCKVKYGAHISIGTMGPPLAESALKQAQVLTDAEELNLYSDRLFAGADTLATAEVLKNGVENMFGGNKIDIVFSGHRASDGETGQTGPQTAWKLGYTFLGNVIDFHIDLDRKVVIAKRLISLQGMDNIIEEIESPLPVFITIDPSYRSIFNTVSQRLAANKLSKEGRKHSEEYGQILRIFDSKKLNLDPKLVGLPGSPTIVYRVEKIPRAKTNRKTEFIDPSNPNNLTPVTTKIIQVLSGK